MSSLPRLSSKPVLRPFAVPGKDLATDAAYIDAAIQLDPGISARWVFDAIMHHVAELPTRQEFEKMRDDLAAAEAELQDAPSEDDVHDAHRDAQLDIANRLATIRNEPESEWDDLLEALTAELEDGDF